MGFETMPNKKGTEKEKTDQPKKLEKELERINKWIDQVEESNNDPEKQRLYKEGSERERLVLENHPDSDEKKATELCFFMMKSFKNNPETVRKILESTPGYKV